jgi:hypothetical protein
MRFSQALIAVVVGAATAALTVPAAAQTPPAAGQPAPTGSKAPTATKAPAPAPAPARAPAAKAPAPAPAPAPAARAPAAPAATKAPADTRPGHRAVKGHRGLRRPVVVDAPIKPRVTGPPGSFEALLGAAEDIGDLARTLEPFTELCNEDRDMTRRQCEVVRAYLRNVLQRRTFRSDVETGALMVGPYVQKQGGRTVTLRGCVACSQPVAGDRRHLVTVRPPAKVTAEELKGLDVTTLKVPHPSAHVGELWERDVGSKLRAEFIGKLGPVWTQRTGKGKVPRKGAAPAKGGWDDGSGEIRGLAMNLLGYRVYNRCTGDVLVSSPKAAFKVPVPANQPDCPKPEVKVAASQPGVRQPDPSWPYVLSVGEIRRSMDAVRGQVRACYLQFQIPGTAELEIDIGGLDGNVLGVKILGKFEDTPTGDCVTSALGAARFQNFRATAMKVPYNFYLQ